MGLPAGISGPKRQALKILSLQSYLLRGKAHSAPSAQAAAKLVGLSTDEGRNFKIVLVIGEVFMAGIVRTAARLTDNFTLLQIRRTAAVFIVPAFHLRAA